MNEIIRDLKEKQASWLRQAAIFSTAKDAALKSADLNEEYARGAQKKSDEYMEAIRLLEGGPVND